MKAQKTILLIINPIAGGTDKEPIINSFKKHLEQKEIKPIIYETTGDDDKEAIEKIIDDENPDRVFISGGDGTIREVADALKDKQVKIGLLPSGSANGLASNFNLPEDLDELLAIGLGDHFLDLDMLEINGYTCLHIADMGVNAKLIENYEKSELRGKLGYFVQAFPTLLANDYPFKVKIEANGEIYEEEGILIAIANANKFGTGANINPTGKMDDGLFEILVFKNFSIKGILETFYGESKPNPEFVTAISCKEAIIKSEKPVAFQIDGEFIGEESEVEAKMTSFNLKIAIP